MRKGVSYLLWLFMLAFIPAVCIAQYGKIAVVIEPVFNGQPLVLSDRQYVNSNGDTLTIDLLKFYITNLKLISPTGTCIDSTAHLVDAERPLSCRFDIRNATAGNYGSIEFTLGVDSITNTNGANAGDLDPAKGMYWAWNTGYVMAKLEGTSNVCQTLHHAFEYHVGGYMPPYNAARSIKLDLPKDTKLTNATIVVKADVAAWFKGVSLSKTNSIVIPGKEAAQMADNYARMFTIGKVNQQ